MFRWFFKNRHRLIWQGECHIHYMHVVRKPVFVVYGKLHPFFKFNMHFWIII